MAKLPRRAEPRSNGTLDSAPALLHKPPVFSRIGHFVLILALLGATGAHWAVLQSVAWASMLADNARVAPLSTALEKTFDGKHPCALCKKIAEGRQSEKKSDVQTELKKLDFLNQQLAFMLNSPAHFILTGQSNDLALSLSQTPPVPPPRFLPV
jgi:hypothetical protein